MTPDWDGVDEVAVWRAVQGDPVRLTRAERVEAVRQLSAAGWSARAAAERLGLAHETVWRIRRRHAIPAPDPVTVTGDRSRPVAGSWGWRR